MKAKISVDKLSKALELVRRVPDEKSTWVLCSTLRVEFFQDGKLRIQANNTKQWMVVDVEGAEVDDPGAVTIPAKRLVGWVKSFDEGEVRFSLDKTDSLSAVLSVGKARTKIKGFDPDEFPEVPSLSVQDHDFSLSAKDFQKKLGAIKWAFRSDKDALPVQRAANLLCRQDGSVQIRSFDGLSSLSMVDLDIENPAERVEEASVYLPDELLSSMAFRDGEIKVTVTDQKVEFIQDGLMCGGSILMGNFPDVSLLKVTDGSPKVSVVSGDLKAAVSRIETVIDDAISCVFEISPTDFVIRSRTGSIASASENLPVNTEGVADEGKKVVFSLPKLKSLLSSYVGGMVVFESDERIARFSDESLSGDWVAYQALMAQVGNE